MRFSLTSWSLSRKECHRQHLGGCWWRCNWSTCAAKKGGNGRHGPEEPCFRSAPVKLHCLIWRVGRKQSIRLYPCVAVNSPSRKCVIREQVNLQDWAAACQAALQLQLQAHTVRRKQPQQVAPCVYLRLQLAGCCCPAGLLPLVCSQRARACR
jgi:hypothetical protein